MVDQYYRFEYVNNYDGKLDEYEIFNDQLSPVISELPENVYRIWSYAFTEMLNNAIDHSESPKIYGQIIKNKFETGVYISDIGVGIFEKISKYYNFDNLNDAISALFKGKLTTDAENHSGEGIFFTSRMMDKFLALSSGKIFSHDPHIDLCRDIESIPGLEEFKDGRGTTIVMYLENNSTRTTGEVFDMFADVDGGFVKTHIPMKNIFSGGYPVSRSQAKRLSVGFENFEEIILDFNGIDDLGQGFAHELFVVYKNKHPQIKFDIINANENVKKMINHVTK